MREHGGKMPLGILRTVVPAAPDAWITALRDYGTMSFGDVAGAAIRYARDGLRRVPVHGDHDQRVRRRLLARGRPTPRSSCPAASRRKSATASCRPTWPATLQYMVDEERGGAGAAAPPASRPRARRSTAATSPRRSWRTTSENGGYLARDDLAGFHCRYEAPVRIRWRDFEV